MTSILIDLAAKSDPFITDCIKAIKNVADDLEIVFFIVGATARDLILSQHYGLPTGLETMDIDFGITVTGWEHFEEMKNKLISTGSFSPDKKTVHRLKYKNSLPVDIIPFGLVEKSEGFISWPPEYAIEMNVTGFQDTLKHAITVHLAKELDIQFVSIPGMAILKLIAWNERHHEFPTKDAVDIATLLKYYPQAGNEERLFSSHSDLMETENFDYEYAGARLLGRDMAGIMSSQTKKTVLEILTVNTNPDKNDGLIISITDYLPDKNYEKALKLLQNLKKGITDKRDSFEC